MRPRSLVPALALVGACNGPELIGPEDPEFGELCTIYVFEVFGGEITREQMERCESILIIIVRFDGSEDRYEVPVATWDSIVSDLIDRVRHDEHMEDLERALDLEPDEVDDFERSVLANCYQSRKGPLPTERVH